MLVKYRNEIVVYRQMSEINTEGVSRKRNKPLFLTRPQAFV